jgi:hypothetical protein
VPEGVLVGVEEVAHVVRVTTKRKGLAGIVEEEIDVVEAQIERARHWDEPRSDTMLARTMSGRLLMMQSPPVGAVAVGSRDDGAGDATGSGGDARGEFPQALSAGFSCIESRGQ